MRADQDQLPSAPPSLYEQLDQQRDCTRLLRIEAAKSDDDGIVCSLFKVEFSERPQYDALSYVWGDGSARSEITLNGVTVRVRQNLGDGLRYLRANAPDTYYWIDAICINQNDVRERNSQVRMMHHIYFRAQAVVVWLGKRYAKYESSLPDLRRLGHREPSHGHANLEESADQPQSDLSTTQQPPSEDAQQHKLAEELYNDGYWNRLWIIQEIGHARNIKVCFGHSAVKWDQFVHFITMHNIGSHGPIRLNRQRQGKYTGSSSLLQLLEDHQEALCQDRKDKVYGLVGLASDAGGFVIDYEKSILEIWTDVMEFMNRRGLFANKDIVYVGGLVKSLLMDADCQPLQQILRQYEPGKGDDVIISNQNHFKAFELRTAMLGCVHYVGPSPLEVVGNLPKVDEWTEQVQANYKDDLGHAHRESDMLVRAILDMDDNSLSKKCFDCRSVVQWSASFHEWDRTDMNEGLMNCRRWIERVQSTSSGEHEQKDSSTEKSTVNNSRLFQISDPYMRKTPWKMGLASSNIRTGDLICWLQWPRRAVVVRPQQSTNDDYVWKLQVVGTAVVTEDLEESSLSCGQRAGWSENKLQQTVYLDARTIFILLA